LLELQALVSIIDDATWMKLPAALRTEVVAVLGASCSASDSVGAVRAATRQ
jgi:hypothetical protein